MNEKELSMDEALRLQVQAREKYRQDQIAREQEQLETGIKQGIKQGEKNKSIEIAKQAIIMGFNDKQIMKLTGLSEIEIIKLKDRLKDDV